MKNYIVLLFLLLGLAGMSYSTVYYIAPDGNDTNAGTIDEPLASIQKAQQLMSAGDTVYIRGGEYIIQESDISYVEDGLFACISYLNKNGTAGKRINYWAYPGETPVFDFSTVMPANQRVVGIWVEGDYIHIKGLEMTGVQVTITEHTESYCIYSWGNYNIFEYIRMHDNQGTGLRHRRGGNNLFLNCDAYRNHDYTSEDGKGSNTDGFGCHPHLGGTGNIFRGCRAWFNSDDAYDVLGANESVVFENCWAMYSGYSPDFQRLADGNGFKAGGYGSTPVDQLPNPIPRHTVQFCVAVRNKANGFYSNHHIGGNNWFNNSAYRNGANYNMLNRMDDNSADVAGYDHKMRNNLGYKGGSEIIQVNYDACDISYNYFDLDVEITYDDFLSLVDSLLLQPRNADGTLPVTDFIRLHPTSDLIDKGEDIGFPFTNEAPDLGAYEQDSIAIGPIQFAHIQNTTLKVYPNPVKDILYVKIIGCNKIHVLDMLGNVLFSSTDKNTIDVSRLETGTYIIRVETKNNGILSQLFVKN